MPVILDSLTFHGRERINQRAMPLCVASPLLRKGAAKVREDIRDYNCIICDLPYKGCIHRYVVRVTKKVNGITHGVVLTAYVVTD